jgi:hypothetical protein
MKDDDMDDYITIAHYNSNRLFLGVNAKPLRDITHWMPLPTPPKEQNK